jgi:diguanylate cyclase
MYGAISIGIAVYPKDGTDAESLRRNADRALYRAKEKGRNTVQCYSLDDALEHSNRIQIEVLLHRAIKNGNFEIHYQPQFTESLARTPTVRPGNVLVDRRKVTHYQLLCF